MTDRRTDHANLDLAQFNLDVVRGKANGRILWQPRLGCWIGDRRFRGEPLPEPYDAMTWQQIHRDLHISARLYGFNECFRGDEDPAVRIARRDLNDTDYEVRAETPAGSQTAVYRRSPNSPWHLPVKWPIADEREMRVAIWREERRTWRFDEEAYRRQLVEGEGLGAPAMYMPRVTIQKLYIDEMGPEGGIYALMDYPDLCEAYFAALNNSHDRLIDVINTSPVHLVNFGDNVHSGTLTPPWFAQYVLPAYQRRCERLRRAPERKFITAHWDGDCQPLLRYARQTGLDGIEAITPKPQGDVTLEETKEALGDMWLVDGIPAILFDRTFSEQELLDCAKRVIDLFAPHLVLGISDEISYTGDIERVRLVGQLVDDYNAAR